MDFSNSFLVTNRIVPWPQGYSSSLSFMCFGFHKIGSLVSKITVWVCSHYRLISLLRSAQATKEHCFFLKMVAWVCVCQYFWYIINTDYFERTKLSQENIFKTAQASVKSRKWVKVLKRDMQLADLTLTHL